MSKSEAARDAAILAAEDAKAQALISISRANKDGSNLSADDLSKWQSLLKLESVVPSGVILMWSGSVEAIPTGWVFCDGKDGTPDLRDRFIVASGNTYGINTNGGSKVKDLNISIAGTSLSINQMPRHTHNVKIDAVAMG